MDQRKVELGRQAGKVVGAGGVDRERRRGLVLADVDLVEGAGVDDHVRPQSAEHLARPLEVADVELRMCEARDPMTLQRRRQIRPELPLRADDDDMSHDRDAYPRQSDRATSSPGFLVSHRGRG